MLSLLLFVLGFVSARAVFAAPSSPSNETNTLVKRQVNARYIWTAFTSNSESNLYVYTSADATTWTLLAGPTYTPPANLIRDPSVLYHTDGKYYIAYTTNWSGQDFAIASSTDAKTWTLHASISTKSSLISPINTWAPEWFKDPQDGNKIKIVVSLSTGSYGPFKPYVYTATDSTLKSFSGPVVMSGIPGDGLGYIDSFPVYLNNQYHLFTKHESNGTKYIEHAVASALTGPYTFVQTGNFAGWGHAEGPCITTLPDGTFRLFADGFDSGKYIYSDSKDLYTWSAYKTLSGGLSGFVRHGTVLKQW